MPDASLDQLLQTAAAHVKAKRFDAAVAVFKELLRLRPDMWGAWVDLGDVLMASGDTKAAFESYSRAAGLSKEDAAIKRFAASFNNLGNFTKNNGHYADAVVCYRRALEMCPDHPDILYNIAQLLCDMGERTQALQVYSRVMHVMPGHLMAHWGYVMAQIPLLLEHVEDQAPSRQAFADGLTALDSWFDAQRTPLGHAVIGGIQPFYLAYQEENNRDLMARYGALCARLMRNWQQTHSRERITTKPRQGPVKLGIVSCHIRNHSVWFAVLKGIIEHMDPARVQIHVFSTDPQQDEETMWAKKNATSFKSLNEDLDKAVEAVLAADLDALFYPQVGMGQVVQKLASLRLCPVQMIGWGHPETSGLPTVDYYLSAEAFEPADGDNAYTEKLVRLPNLGCCYRPLDVPETEVDLAALGIRAGVPLLLSPGAPYKYAPQHDHIFIDIVKKLGDCQIVFFTSRPQDISNKLQARLRAAFDRAGLSFDKTCVFIPWLDRPVFYGLMRRADVFLDTIGFSGFNTAIQAVECGLPIVTHEGKFMRGRLASGILRRLELEKVIADTDKAYVDLAVRLATNVSYRGKLKKAIEQRRSRLFDDVKPVKALEDLLVSLCSEPKKA